MYFSGYSLFAVMFDICFFFFKQKTAYEMRISDWSSDVCSSDLQRQKGGQAEGHRDVVKTIADRSAQRSGRPKARSGRGPGCFASVLQYGAAADEEIGRAHV